MAPFSVGPVTRGDKDGLGVKITGNGSVQYITHNSISLVIELLMSKCVPVLYYGSECCPVSKSQFNSLEFALRGSFIKIFDTRSKDIVENI